MVVVSEDWFKALTSDSFVGVVCLNGGRVSPSLDKILLGICPCWFQLISYNASDKLLILHLTVDGAGCMAALDAEHYLQEVSAQEGKSDWLYLGVATTSLSKSLLMLKATLWWTLCDGLPWLKNLIFLLLICKHALFLISIQKPELLLIFLLLICKHASF
jgi:hypothetical protein